MVGFWPQIYRHRCYLLQRAASLGLENIIETREGDAETIDLSASSYNNTELRGV